MLIEELFIRIPSGNIYVKKWTPENQSFQSPIVLLHDSLGSVALWKDFPKILANSLSRPVIAYDRLGFGQSDARQSLPSNQFIEEEATTYFPQIKQQLALKHYLLLGHSVGGAMAINIAAADNQCDAVITIAAQAFVEEKTLRGIEMAKKHFDNPQQMEKLEKWHQNKASWVLKAWTDVWLNPDFRQWRLNNITQIFCPVLAIHGENDEYGSEKFPEFIVNNTNGKTQLELIIDCGHVPHKSHLMQVLEVIKPFLKTL